MTYRGGIGGNNVTGPRGPRRRVRMSLDRGIALTTMVLTIAHIAWEAVA